MTAPIGWGDMPDNPEPAVTSVLETRQGGSTMTRLLAAESEIQSWRGHCASQRAEIDRLERLVGTRTADRDLACAELASACQELGRLRPIADAARAYATFPDRPPTSDPNQAHMWDSEMEAKYLALLNTVTEAGTA